MNPADFVAHARARLDAGIPLVLYAEPGSTLVKGIFSSAKKADSEFVFAPFNRGPKLSIPFDQDDVFHCELPVVPAVPVSFDDQGEEHFTALVKKALDQIATGHLQKVVVSRCETHDYPVDKLLPAFARMVKQYPSALCYLWYHQGSGLWMGATPERLLRAVGPDFYTMALAGTMPHDPSGHYDWGQKEKAEQRYVTDYIFEKLRPMASEIGQHGPLTAQAGNIVHLKTELSGVMRPDASAGKLVSALHPTPAVCGIPPDGAMSFIGKNEGYDREYYSGYLGIESAGRTDLYVNLRCMKWEAGVATLYMGCGINAGSDPRREYLETVSKSNTIKTIL